MIQEDIAHSAPYRLAYREGLERVLVSRRRDADLRRAAFMTPEKLAENPGFYRSELKKTLGWPLTEKTSLDMPKAALLEEKPYASGVVMRRMQIETLPGLPFYGILFIHENEAKRPLAVACHGGGGTPELAADMHGDNNYRHLIGRLLDMGANVFAPQLLLWREAEEDSPGIRGYGMKANRGQMENSFRQTGGSIVAVEVYSLMRCLDCLLADPLLNPDRVGMIGLSYGGFYTQMTAALDTRITVAVSNAFFNDWYHYAWHDFTWFDSAARFLDAEICALIAPRALCVHVGVNDKVFDINTAKPEMARLVPFYEKQNASNQLKFLVSEANHQLSDSGEEMDFFRDHLML